MVLRAALLSQQQSPSSSSPPPAENLAVTASRTSTKPQTDHAFSSGVVVKSAASTDEQPFAPTLPTRGSFIKHYEIIRNLDQGGMGVVFLARDTKLGRLVAIKFLKDSARGSTRLLEEAQVTAGIKHENIVTIHDIDEFDDHLYLILEYVEGRTLRQVIAQNAAHDRYMAKGLALQVMTQVVRGLVAAHAVGVVHRDLKPENVMLLDSGPVKILDFGIAKRIDQSAVGRSGTRPYMSPEQWRAEEVDPRTDIWAAGLLLFELLTGKHPLAPLSDSRLATISDLDQPLPSLSMLRPNLGHLPAIVDRCLCKHKEERFPSASALLDALTAAMPHAHHVVRDGAGPFAGLSAFQESDAGRFFGRDREIQVLVGQLDRQRIVTIVGPSGAGKSSFVRAGVIPALRTAEDDWDICAIRPGRAPLAALTEALGPIEAGRSLLSQPGLIGERLRAKCRQGGETCRVLLFVDQFEELFTLVTDAEERAAFLHCLLGAADEVSSPVRVILSVRSDFLDRIAEERHFMDHVMGGLFFVSPMEREGLHEALVRPIEAVGYQFESDDMIADMLRSLETTKSPLPLLQFTAARLWEARDQHRQLLTRRSYDALGGVAGALSTHADALLAALSPHQQRLCRAICLRLITPQRTRAIVSTNELAELSNRDPDVMTVVQHLGNARLLLIDAGNAESGATVELVHESLIERWPTLSRWIDESADDAEFLARLRSATTQWLSSGKRPGLLWRDHVAEEARAWYARRKRTIGHAADDAIGTHERHYLEAVAYLFETTARRRRLAIAGAFAIMTVALSSVAYFAWQSQTHAKRADLEAQVVRDKNVELEKQALRGRNATRIMAARKRSNDPMLALALLREVEKEDVPRDWPELVSHALTTGVAQVERLLTPEQIPYTAMFSPDDQQIAVGIGDGTVLVLDAKNLETRVVLRGHSNYIWSVGWSPDGKRIMTASGDKTARIMRADGLGQPIELLGHEDTLTTVTMSPDGERVLTAAEDNTARIWRASDGKHLQTLELSAKVQAAYFSPDGHRILTLSKDGMGHLWNANGSDKRLLFKSPAGTLTSAAFSADGKRIATGGADGLGRVWDASDGKLLATLRGHEGKIMHVSFSPDGLRIATTSKDKTARIWNSDGSRAPIVLRGHQNWVYSTNFAANNRLVVTTSLDKSVRTWNLDTLMTPLVLRGHTATVTNHAVSPDSRRIATTSMDSTVRIWNVDGSGSPVLLRGHETTVLHAAWSADGRKLLTLTQNDTVRIWDLETETPLATMAHGDGPLRALDWSYDGQFIVTLSITGVLRWWSATGELTASVKHHPLTASGMVGIKFDPQGKRAVLVDHSHDSIAIANVDDREHIDIVGHHDAGVPDARWSPDGTRLATASKDHSVRIWNVAERTWKTIFHDAGPLFHVRWAPDGHRVGLLRTDGALLVQPVDSVGEPVVISTPGFRVRRFAWSHDGTRIFTDSGDSLAHVWNADGSGFPFVLVHPAMTLAAASGTPDGKHIVVRPDDNVVFLWPDVKPFTGPDDPRLWTATTHCIPVAVRMELLGVDEAKAREDEQSCIRRVNLANGLNGP